MNAKFKHSIFFDLDGTLTDPYVGISRSIQHALDELRVDHPADFRWCIGPPLLDTFATLVGDARSDHALQIYRERFSEIGWQENTVYADIELVLRTLSQRGHPLYVATSKPWIYANRILEHFGLAQYFVDIFGSELSGERTDKTELLAYALRRHPQEMPATMIGDRRHDMLGAINNRLTPVGVSYGFGSYDELVTAGATRIIDRPAELLDLWEE